MDFEPEVIQDANKLLAFLVGRMNKHYLDVMQEGLSDSEYDHNYRTLKKNLQTAGLEAAAGAVAAGTGIAKDEAGLSGEAGQKAIQALKKSGRLQQCGRGRGKCLVVLTATLLPTEEENGQEQAEPVQAVAAKVEEEEKDVAVADNIPSLLRNVRDQYRDLERQLRESRRNETHMSKLIEELRAQLDESNAKITELENMAQLKAVATWQ